MSIDLTKLDYVSEASVNSSQFKNLQEIPFGILKVYSPYRHWWDDVAKKFRSFYNFPKRITDDVVFSGDERAKIQEGDEFELREKYWDDSAKKFAFKKFVPYQGFTKMAKKVFDVDITPSSDVSFNIWDNSIKQEVPVKFGRGSTFTIKALGASKIISAIEALDLDAGVQLVERKDRTGNLVKARPFDFEDAIAKSLAGKFVSFKVRGSGMETRYSFKEANEFDPAEVPKTSVSIEDVPF